MKVDKSRKHIVRMGEDASWLPTFSPPCTMFQKAYFPEAKVYCLLHIKIAQENKTEGKR